ncbi:hypothetical protein [Amycolatopsis sp. NPDC059021]|uniref:hypothetical protein n=1 Tax=Amycolatopsis sp. NPDC059021 TaxID=3346704 RepID=UPI00366F10F9
MTWVRLAGACKNVEDCPTVFVTDRGTIAVQGDLLDVGAPNGEAVVEIPVDLLVEAARAIR